MIKVYSDTKIFVAAPARVATGGPELLHQLVYNIRNILNIDAYVYYYNFNNNIYIDPVHPEYKNYNIPFVINIPKYEDNNRNILIVPEVYDGVFLLSKYRNIRKGIWFLSVDNYYYSRIFKIKPIGFTTYIISKYLNYDIYDEVIFKIITKLFDYRKDNLLNNADFYMAQCYRCMQWFNALKPMYYLSDYINLQFLNEKIDLKEKKNVVAYSPRKGYPFTRKIIKKAKNIKFIQIYGLSKDMLIKTLKMSKVFIDFGHHPGKDRMPREAAILGNCVLTSTRGSAAFFEDVPIPIKYKFETRKENIPKIIDTILDCFENFEERYKEFEYYRKIIRNEYKKFIEDLKNVFIKVY